MSIDSLLASYKKLTDITEQMLALVEDELWDSLILLQIEYEKKVQLMRMIQRQQDLKGNFSAEHYLSINIELKKILANNAQLKRLINQRCGHLSGLISETIGQRTQINSYHQVASMR